MTTETGTPAAQPAAQTAVSKPTNDFERLLLRDIKTQVSYQAFGSDDEIKLSVPLIRQYIAVPAMRDGPNGTKEEVLPDDKQCLKFLMLNRARRLNPWEGDSFMVPFWDKRTNSHQWSLITAHSALLKRAELHVGFDGMESGVIVEEEDSGDIVYREGDFTLATDKLLGGWSTVYFKNRSKPVKARVKLATYVQPFGVWVKDPAGMICKVAEAGALRVAFPTMCGGMYLREESAVREEGDTDTAAKSTVKRPDFGKGLPAPDMMPKAAPIGQNRVAESPKSPVEATKPAQDASAPLGSPPASTQAANATPAPAQEQPQATANPTGRANRPTMVEETPEPPDDPGEEELAAAGLAPAQPAGQFLPTPGDTDVVASVRLLAHNAGLTEPQLIRFLQANKIARGETTLMEFEVNKRGGKLLSFCKAFEANPAEFVKNIIAANAA